MIYGYNNNNNNSYNYNFILCLMLEYNSVMLTHLNRLVIALFFSSSLVDDNSFTYRVSLTYPQNTWSHTRTT